MSETLEKRCTDCDGSGETAESLEASLRSQAEYFAAPNCQRCEGYGYIYDDEGEKGKS